MQAGRLLSLALLALMAIGVAGCSVQLRTDTQPRDACEMALASGRLVADARSGLGLADTTGEVTPVIWPFGYSARREASGVVLLDETGRAVAREGDHIEMGGGFGADAFAACAGSIKVVPAPG
jgi:hypothetical protein